MVAPSTSSVLPQIEITRPPSRTKRILFALNDYERRVFLPDELAQEIGALDIEAHWLPDDSQSPADWSAMLKDLQPEIIVSCWSTPAIPSALVARNSSLAYVCHTVGSVRNLVSRAFLERGGLLSNWGTIAGKTVAEHALLLSLSALRNQPTWRPIIHGPRANPWRPGSVRLKTRSLFGRRVGIHGFGNVARALVELLRPFDVEIASYSHGVPAAIMRSAGVIPCESLAELAAHSEVFYECEALTQRSAGSIDKTVLAALPDQAVFVNVGRGALVCEAALLNEAESGRIQIALDVVTREPLDSSSPLTALASAVLSPHIAGPTFDHFPLCGQLALDNIARYLRGEPLEARITSELYDRAT